MSISERIKGLCVEKGITVNQLEKESGVGRGSISRWDAHSPSVEKVATVANYFEVTIDYLLSGEGQKEKPTPVAGDGFSELDKRLNELLAQAADETKRAMIVLLERSQRR